MENIDNLSQLTAAGGYVPREPYQRDVHWVRTNEDGTENEFNVKVFFKRHDLSSVLGAGEKPKDAETVAWDLSKNWMMADDQGVPKLVTYDYAAGIDPTLAMAIWKVLQELRNPKKSRQTKSSSVTSSSAASADAP